MNIAMGRRPGIEPYLEMAKAYVDQQLDTMRKYGNAPELTEEEYQQLIEGVARIVAGRRTTG